MSEFKNGGRLWLGIAVAVGDLSGSISPVLLGAVSDGLSLSESQAGLLTSLEMLAFGICTLCVGPFIAAVPKRRFAIAAGVVAFLSQLISAVSMDYVLIAIARVCAGVGDGALVATAYAIVAGRRDSQRTYGYCLAIMVLSASLAYVTVPLIASRAGHHGAYGLVAALLLIALPLLFLLPDRASSQVWPAASSTTRKGDVICLLCGVLLVLFSDGFVWPLSERVGHSLQIGPGQLGLLLGLSSLVGGIGPLMAGRMGSRFGLLFPMLSAVWATAAGGLLLMHASGPTTLFLGAVTKNVTLMFFVTYAMETAAVLDRQGRIAAIVAGVIPLGSGLGPFVAGVIVEQTSFPIAGWASVLVMALATPLLLRVLSQPSVNRSNTDR